MVHTNEPGKYEGVMGNKVKSIIPNAREELDGEIGIKWMIVKLRIFIQIKVQIGHLIFLKELERLSTKSRFIKKSKKIDDIDEKTSIRLAEREKDCFSRWTFTFEIYMWV